MNFSSLFKFRKFWSVINSNIGSQWSETSVNIICKRVTGIVEKILSMRVAVSSVTRIADLHDGRSDFDMFMHRNSSDFSCK